MERFHEIAGPSFYRRVDIHFQRSEYDAVKRHVLVDLLEKAPETLAGQVVASTQPLTTNDGFKFFIADGSWLLVRASGTEPLMRVYTEATSPEVREAIIAAGEQLVRGE
jgi:phosphomannomutase